MTETPAIKVTANTKAVGRIQRAVLDTLAMGGNRTTEELALQIYSVAGTFELNSILRAIHHLSKRGFAFKKSRKGRVGQSGYVYSWGLKA